MQIAGVVYRTIYSIVNPRENCFLHNCPYSSYFCIHANKGVFKGGFRGFKPPPPPKFSDFFLKSEGKEIERKRKKKGMWGGGLPLNIFLGLIIF